MSGAATKGGLPPVSSKKAKGADLKVAAGAPSPKHAGGGKPLPETVLIYDRGTEFLSGTIAGTEVEILCGSGGSRASTKAPRGTKLYVFDTYLEETKGGVTPAGTYALYWLGPYKAYADGAVFLKPDAARAKEIGKTRSANDFLIHGPGPRGSEGCVVPYDRRDYLALMRLFKKYPVSDRKPIGTLTVTGDPADAWRRHTSDALELREIFRNVG